MPRTPILQVGTSRFLQAHADLYIDEAGAGPITVVQSSGDVGRLGRLTALAAPDGFPVRVRGLWQGREIDRTQRVRSVARALSTSTDWPEVARVAAEEAEIILSNTGDGGWAPSTADGEATFRQEMSYPAKLLHLLLARHGAGGAPVQVMPLELIPRNGEVLRGRVLALAEGRPRPVREWLASGVTWASSLVDRIVSEPIEPAGAVAEPYGLWAIGAGPGVVAPCRHEAVQVVDDLDAVATLKLYILNLGHTVLADAWLGRGGAAPRLVREAMAGPEGERLCGILEAEVIPGFARAGREGEARAYLATTLERFSNPFLDHRLADIAGDHDEKRRRRIAGFLGWARGLGDDEPKPQLEAIAASLA